MVRLVLLLLLAGLVGLFGVWLLDERNRIALFDEERNLTTHARILGVEEGMPIDAAAEKLASVGLERSGMDEAIGPYAINRCGGQSVPRSPDTGKVSDGFELRHFANLDRSPIGFACLLARDGRVIAMDAAYVLFQPF